jgi:hydroxymethylbilane synthase
LRAIVAAPDGSTILSETLTGSVDDAEAIGDAVAERLLDQGAGQFLEQ